ncbi:acyl-CoA dehydrogenase family protein [Hyphomonas neptunium ATCC 15444]|uniref:Acyl-CoA dehydrogenase family protein n=2 Tax=Hyphomonas TaxID=85 RepID=Q0BXN8_HYPNA|nr:MULTISPECIES: acyl-CoA dehydrogenase family protein [Hyphomonas]ABI76797.1 acyl-CoA dehydrogenase family protein [Hyphomonas neptunium ATCC 15444]KCZ93555.1 acyl-CoA dehydrogenase family protein [Hyphomonas hirschiana VP5]
MSFVLTEDQEMLRETATAFARDELSITHLRALRDAGANGKDAKTRQKLAELGFFGVIIPDEPGAETFGLTGLGQILEAQGATLAATPLLQTALIAASALQLGGSPAQQAEWLPKIAGGETTFALALDETAHFAPYNVSTEAERNGQGYTINGLKKYVPDAHHADMLIVVARTFGESGDRHGLSLFLVPRDAKGVTITELKTVDSHGAAHVTLENVNVAESALIGPADQGADILDPVLDRAAIGLAAEMLGSAQAAFDMTLEYLNNRKQFGQLIGSFQSMQHRAAKMFIDLEMTRSCVASALAAADDGKSDLAELASLAKALASELVHLVSNECVQMHGGIGMTDVADPGFYMKRARVQEALYGSASWHRDRYARLNGF